MQNGGHFETEQYYCKFPNQTPVTILIFVIYKLGMLLNISVQNLNNFAIIINSLFVAVAAYFIYLSVKKLKDEKIGLLTLIFFVVNPIFYLQSSYFYDSNIYIYIYIPGNRAALRKTYYYLFC